MIQLDHIADLTVLVAEPIEVGPTPRGRILPAGADFQILRRDGVAELHARYSLQTVEGALVYVENTGFRHGPPDAMEKIRRGEPVDPAQIYFRTAARFETAGESHLWLTRHLFIASGARRPDRVELAVYQVM